MISLWGWRVVPSRWAGKHASCREFAAVTVHEPRRPASIECAVSRFGLSGSSRLLTNGQQDLIVGCQGAFDGDSSLSDRSPRQVGSQALARTERPCHTPRQRSERAVPRGGALLRPKRE